MGYGARMREKGGGYRDYHAPSIPTNREGNVPSNALNHPWLCLCHGIEHAVFTCVPELTPSRA
jgi:hypothetical protein